MHFKINFVSVPIFETRPLLILKMKGTQTDYHKIKGKFLRVEY